MAPLLLAMLFGSARAHNYTYFRGALAAGNDAQPHGMHTIAEAEAICSGLASCRGFSFHAENGQNATGAQDVYVYSGYLGPRYKANTKNYPGDVMASYSVDWSRLAAAGLGVAVVGYGEHHVLRGVDLEVAAGTTAAVVGATGSGKSTLLEAVAGVLDRTEGTIAIGGVDIADVAADDWTTAVAIAFQESFLFTDTIVENVALGAVGLEEVHRTLAIARADGFVADLADAEVTVVGERGTTLSGGQRQRVALARALARRPQVLLLDDATSAVDPLVEAEILDALRAELDMTVLVVAHRISTILLADNVVYLDDGQVVATGTHEELLRRDDYQALVTAYEQGEGS